MRLNKKIMLTLICGVVLLAIAGCGGTEDKSNDMSNMDHSNMKMEEPKK